MANLNPSSYLCMTFQASTSCFSNQSLSHSSTLVLMLHIFKVKVFKIHLQCLLSIGSLQHLYQAYQCDANSLTSPLSLGTGCGMGEGGRQRTQLVERNLLWLPSLFKSPVIPPNFTSLGDFCLKATVTDLQEH